MPRRSHPTFPGPIAASSAAASAARRACRSTAERSTPMAQQSSFDLGGMSPDQVYSELQKLGVDKSDASIMISEWIQDTILHGPRTFNYQTAFPGVDHACEVTFTRI